MAKPEETENPVNYQTAHAVAQFKKLNAKLRREKLELEKAARAAITNMNFGIIKDFLDHGERAPLGDMTPEEMVATAIIQREDAQADLEASMAQRLKLRAEMAAESESKALLVNELEEQERIRATLREDMRGAMAELDQLRKLLSESHANEKRLHEYGEREHAELGETKKALTQMITKETQRMAKPFLEPKLRPGPDHPGHCHIDNCEGPRVSGSWFCEGHADVCVRMPITCYSDTCPSPRDPDSIFCAQHSAALDRARRGDPTEECAQGDCAEMAVQDAWCTEHHSKGIEALREWFNKHTNTTGAGPASPQKIIRKPEGSTAMVGDDGTFTPDLPGSYLVKAAIVGEPTPKMTSVQLNSFKPAGICWEANPEFDSVCILEEDHPPPCGWTDAGVHEAYIGRIEVAPDDPDAYVEKLVEAVKEKSTVRFYGKPPEKRDMATGAKSYACACGVTFCESDFHVCTNTAPSVELDPDAPQVLIPDGTAKPIPAGYILVCDGCMKPLGNNYAQDVPGRGDLCSECHNPLKAKPERTRCPGCNGWGMAPGHECQRQHEAIGCWCTKGEVSPGSSGWKCSVHDHLNFSDVTVNSTGKVRASCNLCAVALCPVLG